MTEKAAGTKIWCPFYKRCPSYLGVRLEGFDCTANSGKTYLEAGDI